MTIASEITRLQYAKADIRQAIIDKGVDVCADLTLDDYACCIAEIQTGSKIHKLKYLGVGGGASGGCMGGGGGGCVELGDIVGIDSSYCITIGAGGTGASQSYGNNGGETSIKDTSCFVEKVFPGGCKATNQFVGGKSASGFNGGTCKYSWYDGGGGGGQTGNGGNSTACCKGGVGGAGLCGYGGGGGGGGTAGGGAGNSGGGNGGSGGAGGNATNCGGGGGGSGCWTNKGGNGAGGLVELCYKTDGSFGITCATGGTVTTSGGYNIHTFTSNGTFCIVC